MDNARWLKLIAVNILTTTGLVCAFVAIILVTRGEFALSLAIALVGFMCDALDGPLARRFCVVTQRGARYDACVDCMLYLVYPTVSWYLFFAFNSTLSVLLLLFFLTCGVFRLVRTTKEGVLQKEGRFYFIGAPVVLSLPLLAGSVAITSIASGTHTAYLYVLLPLFSLFMVSRIPFPKPAGREMGIMLLLTGVIVLGLLVL